MRPQRSLLPIFPLAVLGLIGPFGCDQNWPTTPSNVPPGGGHLSIAFTSDRDGNAEIYKMASDGSDPINLSQNPAGDFNPDLSFDATHVIFASVRDGNYEIYSMAVTGSSQVRLTNRSYEDDHPAWSPDGSKIALDGFFLTTDFAVHMGYSVYTIDPAGNTLTAFSGLSSNEKEPAWSWDGTKITFASRVGPDGFPKICASDANGSNAATLTTHASMSLSPSWSPDGTRIAFSTNRDGNYEIYVMDADGSNPVNLTNHSADDFYPCWSPSGNYIAFSTDRDGNQEIYRIRSDGSSPKNLTQNPAEDWNPSWR